MVASKNQGENLDLGISSSNLAYVVYTSGTTGKPKGVPTTHQAVVNCILALNDTYDFTYGNKVAAFASYVFDVSVAEFFTTLFRGGVLHLLSQQVKIDPYLISNYIIHNQINYIYLPPAMLANLPLVEHHTLLGIIYAGEPCDKRIAEYWAKQHKLYNYYGTTETTIYSSCKLITEGVEVKYIGKPIYNLQYYILDPNLKCTPVGVIGELYIGGVGLARGYLNKADLTAEKFIDNPFQTEEEKADKKDSPSGKNAKLYKTGDLVRWVPDGNIEYIGRSDFQVKIRGYRIELGEVEGALSSYEGVRQSVVLARDHRGLEGKYLVGYYVAGSKLDESGIMSYLQSKLPEYMVPSALVHLEKLPLTINGKLDRDALPEPEFTISTDYMPPRSALEKQVCQIWAEVLGLPENKLGIQDDFFRLGGNSILAIKLVSKINKELSINIDIANVFEARTIARLINDHMVMDNYIIASPRKFIATGEEYEF